MKSFILFFDGYCNLCNGFIDFAIRRDRGARLAFASLQGRTAQEILPEEFRAKRETDPSSILYWRAGELLFRSDAILFALSDLGGLWKLLLVFRIIPRPVRDFSYNFVARNRFRFFGRRSSCRMPEPHEKNRLLP